MGADKGQNANPPGDGWDDDGWNLYDDGSSDDYWLADDDALWADAALDGRVRQQLATLVPLRHEAFDRWDEIQPRLTRARRRRRAGQALATSVLVTAVALIGLQGAGRLMPDDTSVVQTADGGEVETSDSQPPMVGIGQATSTIAVDDGTAASSAGASLAPGGDGSDDEETAPTEAQTAGETSASPGSVTGSSSVPANGGSAASSVSIPPPAAYPTTTAGPATNSPTSRSTTSTTRATTTTTRATTTTTASTPTTLTIRDLATVDVTVRGSEIRLVAVHNSLGVTSQVHNSGPQKIEITFREGAEEHDLVATVHNGNVVTSIVDSADD